MISLAVLGAGMIKVAEVIGTRAGVLPGLCGGAAVLVSIVLGLAIIGQFILGPLDAAARHRRRPTQFTMADFLALMFLFQLPVALIRLVVPDKISGLGLIYGFAWVASSLMWGLSVQTLSRAAITTPWRRVVFLSAVLPIAYFGSVVFVTLIVLGCGETLFADSDKQVIPLSWCFSIDAILLGAFCWAASFVRATVARSQNDESVQEISDTPETAGPVNPLD